MTLETMTPNPVWTASAYEDTVETLQKHDDVVYKVWGGDWCKDCRAQLPDFAAALRAADVPEDRIEHFAVEKEDGAKVGPGVEEYDIELIPTIVVERRSTDNRDPEGPGDVVERAGEELFRYVEDADVPPSVYVAERLEAAE